MISCSGISKLKIGDVIYRSRVAVLCDDEVGKFDDMKLKLQEWVVSSVYNKGKPKHVVYVIYKLPGVTWVKLSRKHYDYGWAKPIPQLYRAMLHPDLPTEEYHRSKAGAIAHAIQGFKKSIRECEADDVYFKGDTFVHAKKYINIMKKMQVRARKNK